MHDVTFFGAVILAISVAFGMAIASHSVSERLSIPAPVLFLLAAAIVSDLVPSLALSVRDIERVGVVALIMILFDGGMQIGWSRLRTAAGPIVGIGVVGTFLTAGLVACAAHWLIGAPWSIAALLGAALAPTDPAVLFSVLGNREISGRSDTILEGESGANDPVGISLMFGVIAFVTTTDAGVLDAVGEFLLQMGVGAVVGVAGGLTLQRLLRHTTLPSESLYPLRTLAASGVIYGLASVAHGSGFLAVFIAGVLVGDTRAPYKAAVERFHSAVAGVAEIVVFAALGLTVDLGAVTDDNAWLDGLVLAGVLVLVIRPAVVLPLLARARLRHGERLLVALFGLKGAVPILLAAFAIGAQARGADRVYHIVFVVVLVSVLVQGVAIGPVARRLHVTVRDVEPEPWDLSVRLTKRPEGVVRCVVHEHSSAAGTAIRDLPLGGDTWISMIIRDGALTQARGAMTLQADDEIVLTTEADDPAELRRLFGPPDTREARRAGGTVRS